MEYLQIQPDIKKIGGFIRELRSKRGMTQRELGDSLGVTDKAVSKWERGLSFPDVALLPGLAQILGVSLDELIEGGRIEPESIDTDHVQKVMREAMSYSKMSYSRKMKREILMIFGIAALSISIVCLVINFIFTRSFSWAPYIFWGLLVIVITGTPAFMCKKHRFDLCAFTGTLCLSGYLALIHRRLGNEGWFFPLALPINIIVCAFAYGVGKAFGRFRENKFYAWSITLLLCAAGPLLGVNEVVRFNGIVRTNDFSQMIVLPVCIVLSAALYFIGRLVTKSREGNRNDDIESGS